jgi:uncharacterized protein
MSTNPFLITSYKNPKYFCNRESEAARIIDAVTNNRNIVLVSLRRLGKTGLIKHVYYSLGKKHDFYLFYIDIDNTNNLNDFVNKLINGLVVNQSKRFLNRVIEYIKQLRPVLTFDTVTGQPEIKIDVTGEQQNKIALESLFSYLEKLDKHVIIALDEFQRITDYPEPRVEAFLRSHIQHLNNVSFIYSGSSTHLLQSMFNDYSRPFYHSADFLHLGKLPFDTYSEFIARHFILTNKKINKEDVREGISWADNHTFYVQFLFNTVWGKGVDNITSDTIREVQDEIINSRSTLYMGYKNLLTEKQYLVLQAIGKEKVVEKPNAEKFITKYHLGSASTVNSALKTLIEKELIYHNVEGYKLYDVFHSRWFEMG